MDRSPTPSNPPKRRLSGFGSVRLFEAIPWLMLAATMRLIGYGSSAAVSIPATAISNVAILLAFILVAQRSIEMSGGRTGIGKLQLRDQFTLCVAILRRIVIIMTLATACGFVAGLGKTALHLMFGLDGMAFDQFTNFGRVWSATIAALILLMIVNAESNGGKIDLMIAFAEFRKRWIWLLAAIAALGIANIGLSHIQEWARHVIWLYWQSSDDSQSTKNLVYFVFIFGFATTRLWLTLLVLTYGLKQSYVQLQPPDNLPAQ